MSTKQPTFEEAMNVSIHWCKAWEEGELSDEVLADRVSELLTSQEGARGFLVISLASDFPLLDRCPEAIVVQLRKAGEIIINLTVKNLAMSSAMDVHHKRHKNETQRAGSERVNARCIELLRLLEPNKVKKYLEEMLYEVEVNASNSEFIKRWGYDEEQKKAIISSIYKVPEGKD